jgi:hypothetical protein
MNKLLLGCLCLVASIANAIQVSGTGSTFEEAKQNAFRTAIEFAAGAVITSERESNNYKLVKNEILVYSSGYVSEYKILNSFKTDNQVHVLVEVEVASNKLADRILGVAKEPKAFDTDKHQAQFHTYLNHKQAGDKMLNQILNDYPRKAFKLIQGPHQLKVDIHRNGLIEIPIELSWNYNFIASMNDALKVLEDGSNGLFAVSPGNVTIMVKDPKDLILGTRSKYRFNDTIATSNISQTFRHKQPRILLSLIDTKNQAFFKQCYIPDSISGKKPAFYDASSHVVIFGNQVEKNKIELGFTNMGEVVSHIHRIDLDIVTDNDCP